jgi:hypothetical protein
VLGTLVHGEDGSSVGRLVDVLVDKSGVPREAVLDSGGFLGVGSRRIVVPWQSLHFDPDSKDQTIAVSMTSDQLKAAPEYKGAAHSSPVAAAAPAAGPAPAPAPAQPRAATEPAPAPAGPGPDMPAGPAPSAPAPDSKPAVSSQ